MRGDHRGGGRAQRGNVRAALLVLLADAPMHGYQLMGAIADRTRGAWRPSPGAVYPTISLLEDEGLVTVTPDSGRKLVAITAAGRAFLTENAETIGDPFAEASERAGAAGPDLRADVDQLRVAARSVGMGGDAAQLASAHDILVEARRALYRVLAEDPAPTDESESR